MLYEEIERESVEKMVREFYALVLKDEILSPIFILSLGHDITKGKWPEHLDILDNFWGSMMTGNRGYMSNPFPAHAFLGLTSREPFERWLELFKEVIYKLFVPKLAEKFYKKANILAEQFIDNLGIDDEDDI